MIYNSKQQKKLPGLLFAWVFWQRMIHESGLGWSLSTLNIESMAPLSLFLLCNGVWNHENVDMMF